MKVLLILNELFQWVALLLIAVKIGDLDFEIKKLKPRDYNE